MVVFVVGEALRGEGRDDFVGVRNPAENAALRLDHPEAHFLKFRVVGADAILGNEAVVAAVVGLADGGVDAHFGGDAGDDKVGDALRAYESPATPPPARPRAAGGSAQS